MSETPSPEKPHDIIVWGASGFTGRLVAEYMAARYGVGGNARWAMGGRNGEKLEAVAAEIGAEGAPVVTGDADDPASLDDVARRTNVILTTVGPYQKYGTEMVAACVRAGTDYVDLCGEPNWMREMIDAHHDAARETGARIVHSCGFDSIPFDIGVYYVQKLYREKFGAPAREVKGRVLAMKGGFSGGTAASMLATIEAVGRDPAAREVMKGPYSLAPDPSTERPRQPDQRTPHKDEDLGKWVAPFIMADINARNAHRSNMLLGYPYGTDFQYSEMTAVPNAPAAYMATGGMGAFAGALAVPPLRTLMRNFVLPKPGEGPDKSERESGFYKVLFIAKGDAGEARAIVKGDRDPGYGSTSKLISEAAACLAFDIPKSDLPGGVYTPAAAMAEALLKRLPENAGLSFEPG